MESIMTGTVKFFNTTKGFGFILSDNKDYFVHISALDGQTITEGDNVEFELEQGRKGLQACNVVLV